LRKVCNLTDEDRDFFDIFSIVRPISLRDKECLSAAAGQRVILKRRQLVNGTDIQLRASIAPLNSAHSEFIVFTSLGSEMPALIDTLGLSGKDFAFTDPSVDMLYMLTTQAGLLRDTQALADRLQAAKEEAEALAFTDALTALPNRRALSDYMADLAHDTSGSRGAGFLLHVDLDRFKQVNDSLGHKAGDAVLKRVSQVLNNFAGPGDLVARIGGDEFVVILTNLDDLAAALDVGNAIVDCVSAPLEFQGQLAQVGASIGIATIPPDSEKSVDTLLTEADLALYDVKNAGRGAVKAYCFEMQDREAMTQQLIRDIKPAISDGEFVPFFQVQIDYTNGSIYGAEVLGRWRHKTLGMVMPNSFLYVAERAHLVETIDSAVYAQALDCYAEWQQQGIAPPHLSFNVTARKLKSAGFVDDFIKQLDRRNIAPSCIVFELVETILWDGESDDVREAASRLQAAGFALAIDDFGTGRASLTSLLSVPVSVIKIDREFVTDLHTDPKKAVLVEAIMRIARALELTVVAEGTEHKSECELLWDMGCSIFQGFYFGRPQSASEFTETLRDALWPGAYPSKHAPSPGPVQIQKRDIVSKL